jgi:hypothetical protein
MTNNKFFDYTHDNGISFGEYEKQLKEDWETIHQSSLMIGAELELLYEDLTKQPVTDEVREEIAAMLPEILMNLYCNYAYIAIKEQEKKKSETAPLDC